MMQQRWLGPPGVCPGRRGLRGKLSEHRGKLFKETCMSRRLILAVVFLVLGSIDAGNSSCLWPARTAPSVRGDGGITRVAVGAGDEALPQDVVKVESIVENEAAPAIALAKGVLPQTPPKASRWWMRRLPSLVCCFGHFDDDEMSSHKLWEQLDSLDELERLRLALSTLSEVAAEKQMTEDEKDVIEIKGIDNGGLHFPQDISLDSIQDMFDTFHKQRQRLHVDSLQHMLSRVEPILAALPNIVVLPNNQTITVVGDIHGSLSDLARIFQLRGWPGEGNVYIFNGDFVDRGDKGVEVVATLFALKIALPEYVHLNRGNHEDEHIGRAYGFFDEVMSKYGSVALYDKIQDIFALLPLCTIIEHEAFVVHAGISRYRGTCLSNIAAIQRSKLRTTVKAASDAKKERCKVTPRSLYLMEDLLWSDPSNEPGSERDCEPNHSRGAGTKFGSMVTKEWLKKNGLKALVRSHQCVPKGWDMIDCGEGTSCWTVFSASDYDCGGNDGAVLIFEGEGSGSSPRVVEYQSSPESSSLRSRNRQRLVDLICGHKAELRIELKRVAGKRTHIRVGEWAEALQRVLNLKVDFKALRLELVGLPEDSQCSNKKKADLIDWNAFLERYMIEVTIPGGGGAEVLKDNERPSIEAIFKNRRELAVVFRLLDLDGNGSLGEDEVKKACEMLNKNLPEGRKIDAEDLFRIMDTTKTGTVSVDDFCECWRKQTR